MKFNVEVDCTPGEAREFIGLPDLKPLQSAVLARIEARLLDATSTFSPEGMLKFWFNALPQAGAPYFDTFRRFLEHEAPKT